ncbi:MAG: GNAT family N-acetyltransferase [Bacteroidales bacterium]|nr:GNAT family N-acetyltransferase [Bacteroidales bacterium]
MFANNIHLYSPVKNQPAFGKMSLQIREVIDNKGHREFVAFPYKHYRNDINWVPPMRGDELKMISPAHNPAYAFCEGKFWLAYNNGQCVGRIGAIINHEYNRKRGEKKGRFSRVEFIDDPGVSALLLGTAEKWLREQGMEAIHGPLGFTNLDNQGLLIEGFEYLPSVASTHNHPWYARHLERLGYDKENDWVEFRLFLAKEIPDKALRLAEVIRTRFGLEVVHFTKPAEMRPYGPEVFRLLNKAFSELPYVVPFSDEMIRFYISKYFNLLNPHFVKLILKDGRLLAFILGLPSLSEAMQKAGGRLFPFGVFHLYKAMRNPKVVDLLLTGVDPEYQHMGLPAILITELQKVMMEHRISHVETTGMFETNQKAIQHWKNYEHIQHKRRRCFVKQL